MKKHLKDIMLLLVALFTFTASFADPPTDVGNEKNTIEKVDFEKAVVAEEVTVEAVSYHFNDASLTTAVGEAHLLRWRVPNVWYKQVRRSRSSGINKLARAGPNRSNGLTSVKIKPKV